MYIVLNTFKLANSLPFITQVQCTPVCFQSGVKIIVTKAVKSGQQPVRTPDWARWTQKLWPWSSKTITEAIARPLSGHSARLGNKQSSKVLRKRRVLCGLFHVCERMIVFVAIVFNKRSELSMRLRFVEVCNLPLCLQCSVNEEHYLIQ